MSGEAVNLSRLVLSLSPIPASRTTTFIQSSRFRGADSELFCPSGLLLNIRFHERNGNPRHFRNEPDPIMWNGPPNQITRIFLFDKG